jgi:hypothetical protein
MVGFKRWSCYAKLNQSPAFILDPSLEHAFTSDFDIRYSLFLILPWCILPRTEDTEIKEKVASTSTSTSTFDFYF